MDPYFLHITAFCTRKDKVCGLGGPFYIRQFFYSDLASEIQLKCYKVL